MPYNSFLPATTYNRITSPIDWIEGLRLPKQSAVNKYVVARIALIRLLASSAIELGVHLATASAKTVVGAIQIPVHPFVKGVSPLKTFGEVGNHLTRVTKLAAAMITIPVLGLLKPEWCIRSYRKLSLVDMPKGLLGTAIDKIRRTALAAWASPARNYVLATAFTVTTFVYKYTELLRGAPKISFWHTLTVQRETMWGATTVFGCTAILVGMVTTSIYNNYCLQLINPEESPSTSDKTVESHAIPNDTREHPIPYDRAEPPPLHSKRALRLTYGGMKNPSLAGLIRNPQHQFLLSQCVDLFASGNWRSSATSLTLTVTTPGLSIRQIYFPDPLMALRPPARQKHVKCRAATTPAKAPLVVVSAEAPLALTHVKEPHAPVDARAKAPLAVVDGEALAVTHVEAPLALTHVEEPHAPVDARAKAPLAVVDGEALAVTHVEAPLAVAHVEEAHPPVDAPVVVPTSDSPMASSPAPEPRLEQSPQAPSQTAPSRQQLSNIAANSIGVSSTLTFAVGAVALGLSAPAAIVGGILAGVCGLVATHVAVNQTRDKAAAVIGEAITGALSAGKERPDPKRKPYYLITLLRQLGDAQQNLFAKEMGDFAQKAFISVWKDLDARRTPTSPTMGKLENLVFESGLLKYVLAATQLLSKDDVEIDLATYHVNENAIPAFQTAKDAFKDIIQNLISAQLKENCPVSTKFTNERLENLTKYVTEAVIPTIEFRIIEQANAKIAKYKKRIKFGQKLFNEIVG